MRANIFINGRLVGHLDYEHPRDSRGKVVATPQNCACEAYPCKCNEVAVRIDDGDTAAWFGMSTLERIS